MTTENKANEQRIRVHINESDINVGYANAFRIHSNPEELILDLGLNIPGAAGPDQPPQMVLRINQRVIMHYAAAKRLAMTLSQQIKRYEEQFGEIALQPTSKSSNS